jgi:hypothetical protein
MQPSLGKMSAYKMFNWRDRAASSVEQTVVAFLEIGEAIATRWIQTAKGVLLLQMVPDIGSNLRLRSAARAMVHAVVRRLRRPIHLGEV